LVCWNWRRRRDDIGAEALRGHVEGHARARAGLEEKVDDCLAAQRRDFPHAAAEDLLEGGGRGVDLVDFLEGSSSIVSR